MGRPGTAPNKGSAGPRPSSSDSLPRPGSSSSSAAARTVVSWSSHAPKQPQPQHQATSLENHGGSNVRGDHNHAPKDSPLPSIPPRSLRRPSTASSASAASSGALGRSSPPRAESGGVYIDSDEPPLTSKFSKVASKLKKSRETSVSQLVDKLRDLTEHTKKDLKKAEERLKAANDFSTSSSSFNMTSEDLRASSAPANSSRDAQKQSSLPGVTIMSMGSESFIHDAASRGQSREAGTEEGDRLYRNQINKFIELSRSKSVLFTDPSRREEMQRTRSFKDHKIVNSLRGAAPGFLSREDKLFDFDGKDTEKGLINHEEETISGLYQPRTYAFLKGKAASSSIEVVPSPFFAPEINQTSGRDRDKVFARGSIWQEESRRLLREERDAEEIDFDWERGDTDRNSRSSYGILPKGLDDSKDHIGDGLGHPVKPRLLGRYNSDSSSAIFGSHVDLKATGDLGVGEETPLDQSEDEYDGNINMDNYFGPEARVKFFNLYKKLAQQHQLEELHVGEHEGDHSHISFSPSRSQGNPSLQSLHVESYPPMSPRHKFLTMIVMKARHPPIPIIIRNTYDDHLNLSHKSLGDDYIIYLSAVISELPNVLKVSLRDNRLTDRGLGRFIDMLCRQDKIIEVDLSENKLDSRSAEALAGYLMTPHCSLGTLRLSQADLDDGETARFMDALGENTSITSIDLSHNSIGASAENDRHDYLAIGTVVAKGLMSNYTLKSLDLSFNKLTPPTALKIGNSLQFNKTLTELNLSNNGIKDKGAEAIGAALMANVTLQKLDLSYNGIGAIGATAIAVGLRLDEHIQHINFSGNPIGFTGGRSIVNSLNYHSGPRRVLFFNCSFDESLNNAQSIGYNPTNPAGVYCLDMSNTVSRCIVYELLYLATVRRGCGFRNMKHVTYSADRSKKQMPTKTVAISFRRPDNPAVWVGEPYGPWYGAEARPSHPFTQMDASDWMYCIDRLSLLDFLTGRIWIPPSDGELQFEFYCQPRCPCPIECLNQTGLNRFQAMIKEHPKEKINILKIAGSLMLESHQARVVLKSLEPKLRVEALVNLLPSIRDTSNVIALLNDFVSDLESLRSIQKRLKQLYFVCINSFSGYYSLDINDTIDRMTAMRLMEISAHEHAVAKRLNPLWQPEAHGHTSQYLNRTNFRNVLYGRVPIAGGINDAFFAKGLADKTAGLLQFDFVSITQPMETVRNPSISREGVDALLNKRSFYTIKDQNSSNIQGLIDIASKIGINVPRKAEVRSNKPSIGGRKGSLLASDGSKSGGHSGLVRQGSSGVAPKLVSRRNSSLLNKPRNVKVPCSVPMFGGLAFEEGSLLVDAFINDPADVVEFANRNLTSGIAGAKPITGKFGLDDGRAVLSDLDKNIALYRSDGRGQIDRIVLNLEVRILNELKTQLLEPLGIFIRSEGKRYNPYGVDSLDRGTGPSLSELMGLDNENPYFEIGLEPVPDVSKVNPMFRKYHIGEDVTICGSSIFVQLYVSEWNYESIYQKCHDLILKLFSLLTVTDSCVRVVSHRATESRGPSECLASRLKCDNIQNITVLHQMDVVVDGIAFTEKAIIKSSTEIEGQSAQKYDYLCCFWRWRQRKPQDRGSAVTDFLFSTSSHDIWGTKLFILRSVISDKWITCEQAISLILEFPTFGSDGQLYRESAILSLFSRLIDLENFHTVLDSTLIPDCHNSAYKRIGYLNTLNGFELDRQFLLDLESPECRLVAFLLAKLAAAEPGQNTVDQRFCRSIAELFSFGWSVPADWGEETDRGPSDIVPTKGKFIVKYSSQPERGCRLIPELRAAVQQKYLLLGVPRRTDDQDIYKFDTHDEEWGDSVI